MPGMFTCIILFKPQDTLPRAVYNFTGGEVKTQS